jgi:hypothetical protein
MKLYIRTTTPAQNLKQKDVISTNKSKKYIIKKNGVNYLVIDTNIDT